MNSNTRASDNERNSVLGKPPPMEILISGKCFFTHCADRKALYKFPGKGTEIKNKVGLTVSILSFKIESKMVSIYVGSCCKAPYNSSKELADLPKRSA